MAPGILRPLVGATFHRFRDVGVEILSLKSYTTLPFRGVCGDFIYFDVTARVLMVLGSSRVSTLG